MKKNSKLILVVTCIMMFALVGCNSNGSLAESPTDNPTGSPTGSPTEDATGDETVPLPSFAIVAYDQIGDRGFVDMANAGMEQAANEFGVDYKLFSCNSDPSVLLDTLKAAAENFDVIFILPGYVFDVELAEVVELYPDKTYIYLDGATTLEGAYSVTFNQNEGAFLAGSLAAYLTTDSSVDMINEEKTVGFVGGADMPIIREYQSGYEQGVAYVDSSIKVVAMYAGDHFDSAKGKVTAFNVNSEGADVIFQAAGPTGLGVLEAASDYGFIAIGVDTDQCYLYPNCIASSMLKRVDTAVYEGAKSICLGEQLEQAIVYNVANNGISLADNKYYQGMVPEDIRDKVAEISDAIASGEIVVE